MTTKNKELEIFKKRLISFKENAVQLHIAKAFYKDTHISDTNELANSLTTHLGFLEMTDFQLESELVVLYNKALADQKG